jgi:hypothetical protein
MATWGVNEKFTAREAVSILRHEGVDVTHENLRDWHRREVLPVEPVGRGKDRTYTFGELTYIASLAFVAPHVRYGGLLTAQGVAKHLAEEISKVYVTLGPNKSRKAVDDAPVYALVYELGRRELKLHLEDREMKFHFVAQKYGFKGAVAVHPGRMALNLYARIKEVLAARAGFEDPTEWDAAGNPTSKPEEN